jgi:ADP-heptose:LPS heptosyltransferase
MTQPRSDIPHGAHWIRFTRFFGDALMFHAAVAPLRAAGMPLVAWGPAWVLDLFEGSAGYAAVVPDPPKKDGPWRASRLLRAHSPASLINFTKSARPLAAAFLARVPLRLGCGDGGVHLLTTHDVRFYAQDTPFVERYQGVVRAAFPGLPEPPFLPFRPRAEVLAQVAEARAGLALEDYVVFAPGANSQSKRLSVPSFAALGRRLKQDGLGVLILGNGAEDQRLSGELLQELPWALDLVGRCNLATSAAWICGARALVGMDSGLAHLSAGAGIPTLSVFGPTRPRHSGPWGPRTRVVRREDLSCLECMEGYCPLPEHPCMEQVPFDLLWEGLMEVMA